MIDSALKSKLHFKQFISADMHKEHVALWLLVVLENWAFYKKINIVI